MKITKLEIFFIASLALSFLQLSVFKNFEYAIWFLGALIFFLLLGIVNILLVKK